MDIHHIESPSLRIIKLIKFRIFFKIYLEREDIIQISHQVEFLNQNDPDVILKK